MERRGYVLAGLVFAALWMPIGCNPGQLAMLLMPFTGDRDQPKCKLASKDKKKEVTVAIVCNFASSVTRHDLIAADQDLADRLAQTLNKNFKDNKDKVTIISPSKVRAYQNRMSGNGIVSDQDIAKHFKADYVIGVDITDMDLYAERTSQLFRGKIDLNVRALDLSKAKGEGQEILEEVYTLTYPAAGPIDASSSTPAQFRAQLLGRVTRDISRWFSAVPHNAAHDMD